MLASASAVADVLPTLGIAPGMVNVSIGHNVFWPDFQERGRIADFVGRLRGVGDFVSWDNHISADHMGEVEDSKDDARNFFALEIDLSNFENSIGDKCE